MSGFALELRRASAAVGVVPRLVAERPQEWRLAPFTVVAAAGRGAVIRYARLPVGRTTWDPDEIVAAWRRTIAKLRGVSLAPELFLPMLDEAYRAILRRGRGRDGDRVEITRLRDEIGGPRRSTRAQFSWNLARLRHERRLAYAGRRIDLGVATGVPAKGKLIWIEDAAGGGQYYQTFRFAP